MRGSSVSLCPFAHLRILCNVAKINRGELAHGLKSRFETQAAEPYMLMLLTDVV